MIAKEILRVQFRKNAPADDSNAAHSQCKLNALRMDRKRPALSNANKRKIVNCVDVMTAQSLGHDSLFKRSC